MPNPEFADIRAIQDFPSLIKYLRTELGWPVDEEQADDLSFDYRPAELGLDERLAVKVRAIKQLRPLAGRQPWGIFWIDFEPRRLPVVVMRRILAALVRRQRGQNAHQATWDLRDLMFISATGEGQQRGISFAHFREDEPGKPQLYTFSWDVHESHLYYIQKLNLAALRWPEHTTDAAAWREQWSGAFSVPQGYVPQTAEMLAKEMARMAREIREAVSEIYAVEHVGGPLHQLHLSLKMSLISDLEPADFADMYAQTVTYGLFAARATRSGDFTDAESGVKGLLAHTNPFLRELLGQLTDQQSVDLDELGISGLTTLLGKVDMEAILQSFGRQKRGEDPVIHFYETFMREYDPKQKMRRGEFYTPDAVVSFIVRSVDHLLKTEFNCPDGLAASAPNAEGFMPVILDPATGTGTFLKYVIEVVWDTFYEKNKRLSAADRTVKWNRYVRESLLPRLYAFELKMSPYTIAHMKVGLALQEKGFEFADGERLQIYLTNALQPAHEVARVDTVALAHEAEQANEVKNKAPITIVIGNPPYAGHSSNASRDHQGNYNFIGSLLQDYYKVDGKPLGEKNPKWLQDDYVKFLRFAQWRINQSGSGIVAMITNHGYLDNPTFRGMRQQLMQSFSEIYVLDLHGNTKKKETAPDGSKDENVFDIQQGVAICLMVKKPGTTGLAKVFHADLLGLREYKYECLMTHHCHIGSVEWSKLQPESSQYLFCPQNTTLLSEYEYYPKITEILGLNLLGFQTHRDPVAVSFDKLTLRKQITDYLKHNYSVAKFDEFCKECDYRPFDHRFVYLGKDVCDRPRLDIIGHLFSPNFALGIGRQGMAIGDVEWQVVCCSKGPMDANIFRRGGVNLFPLYLYPSRNAIQKGFFDIQENYSVNARQPNLSREYIISCQECLNLSFIPEGNGDLITNFGPEDAFHYIYAILHSPSYRKRYAGFLKMDFPRIPITSDLELFRELCELGGELVAWHLLEKPIQQTEYYFLGDTPSQPISPGYPKRYNDSIMVNPAEAFQQVPEDVWNFQIGGYQVCAKWLKDRRGRQLSAEDIAHYLKILSALTATIELMGKVDESIQAHGGWPIH